MSAEKVTFIAGAGALFASWFGGWSTDTSYCYVCLYDSSYALVKAINYSNLLTENFGAATITDNNLYRDSSQLTDTSASYTSVAFVRFSCIGDGSNIIATINEEIA